MNISTAQFTNGIIFLLPAALVLRNALADTVIVLLGLAFLIRSARQKDFSWLKTPWVIIAFSLATWSIVRTLVAHWHWDEVSYSGLVIWRWPLFAAALVFWIFHKADRKFYFDLGLLTLLSFIIIDTTVQYFVGTEIFGHTAQGNRLTGPFTKLVPGTYTSRLAFIGVAIIYLSLMQKHHVKLAGYSLIVLPIIALSFTFITGERGAFLITGMLGLICGLTALVVHKSIRLRLILLGTVMALGAGIFAASQPAAMERTIISTTHYIANWSTSPSSQSILPGIEIYKKTYPLIGIGIGNYDHVCNLEQFDGLGQRYCAHPHNVYVETAVELGLIGLVLLLALVVSLILMVLKYDGREKAVVRMLLLCILLATFWPIMGSMSFYGNRLANVVWLSLAWVIFTARAKRDN